MRLRSLLFIASLTAALAPALAFAQEAAERRAPAQQSAVREGVLKLLPADSVTAHELTTAEGRRIAYTATAGTLDLFGQDGGQNAAIFYTAYIARDAGPDRPITFAFNADRGLPRPFCISASSVPKFWISGRTDATAPMRSLSTTRTAGSILPTSC